MNTVSRSTWGTWVGAVCLVVFGLGVQAGETYAGPKEDLHVYLLIGQSNMAGRAPIAKDEEGVVKACYLLNAENLWEPAQNPLNRYSTIRKGLGMQKKNPGYTFAKTMLQKNPGISIGLVVNAKGGTRIDQWQKGTGFYTDAVKRAKAAQQSGTLKGILWHQGESDSKNSAGYLEKLGQLVADLRKDLGLPNLPVVVGQIYYHPTHKPHTQAINDELAKLPRKVPFTACVPADGLTTYDHTHFDAQGMAELGRRYAAAMMEMQAARGR